jgi:hypothetical protein
MKTIVAFIVGLLIATAWAQTDRAHGTVWLPASISTLNGHGYQMGLRNDGVVVAVEPVPLKTSNHPL